MPDDDRMQYILQMARELGLTVPEEEMPRVKAMLGVLEGAAAQVGKASLRSDTIAAAVFRAEQASRK
jgi:Protein of unknown function (DUF4089)